MKYTDFVKQNFHKVDGSTPQEKMKKISEMWKRHKMISIDTHKLKKK